MKKLEVRMVQSPGAVLTVGTLAEDGRRVVFEYSPEFVGKGLELSPFHLPVKPGLIEHTDWGFGPVPGLFDDSLPDGWGMILMNRHFDREGVEPGRVTPLDRLAYLGTRTMGVLTYHPHQEWAKEEQELDLAVLGEGARQVLKGNVSEVLPELMHAGGSPGGARPKVLVGISGAQIVSGEDDLPAGFEHWMVKFLSLGDSPGYGALELAYSLMARASGLEVAPTRLFQAGKGRTYFGTKRFDRGTGNRRRHVHTFANMIHTNFRVYGVSYETLLATVRALTRNGDDVLRAVRHMVFNIASHNRDDHAKNFAFMLDDKDQWTLTPAYDLCLSQGPGGEHSMTVNGEGAAPTRSDVLACAKKYGVKERQTLEVIEDVNDAIARWSEFADEAGCAKKDAAAVKKKLQFL
jgi:serine/threonine-protein kinase HipA